MFVTGMKLLANQSNLVEMINVTNNTPHFSLTKMTLFSNPQRSILCMKSHEGTHLGFLIWK